VEQAYARAHALSDALGSPPQLYIVYFGLWMYYVVTADFRRAMVVCDDLTRMAEAIDTAGYRVEALFCTAYTEYYMGRLLESERHFRAAIALESAVTDEAEFRLSPAGDDVRIHSRVFLGMLLWHLGRSDEAVATAEAGVRIAREIGYPYGIVWGLDSLAWLHVFRNDPGAAAATAMEMVGICQERGFPFFTALGGLILGWSAIQGGDMQTGVPMFEQSLAGLLMAGARQSHTLFRSQLAATYLAQERLDDATAEVDRAFALMDAHDEHAWEPEVHLVHGALLLAQAKRGDGSLDAAAAAYLRARDVARAQGALGYRVRAGLMAAQALPPGSSRDSALEELRSIIPLAEEHGSWPDLERAKVLSAG
jgi:tetratricopeptide (TPR) repeat protein